MLLAERAGIACAPTPRSCCLECETLQFTTRGTKRGWARDPERSATLPLLSCVFNIVVTPLLL